jgi:hypothetical protein
VSLQIDKPEAVAQQFIDSFKGEDGVKGNPFSEQLELNLVTGIAELIADKYDTRSLQRREILRLRKALEGMAKTINNTLYPEAR